MRNRVADTERLVKVIIYSRKSAGLSQMDLAKALGKSVCGKRCADSDKKAF